MLRSLHNISVAGFFFTRLIKELKTQLYFLGALPAKMFFHDHMNAL